MNSTKGAESRDAGQRGASDVRTQPRRAGGAGGTSVQSPVQAVPRALLITVTQLNLSYSCTQHNVGMAGMEHVVSKRRLRKKSVILKVCFALQ